MNEYKQQIDSYIQAVKNEFSLLNDYNTKVISFGFAAFFALATYVKTFCYSPAFIVAILLMSVSVTLFVFYELYRSFLLNQYARGKSLALDKLPDNNPMLLIDNQKDIDNVRFQRFYPYFFFPSLLAGLFAVGLLFYCYVKALVG